MYQLHPSRELQQCFAERPFQGAAPWDATFLFIGLDANYDPQIAHSSSFGNVLAYHEDGVAFWRQHGVHHPFLLPDYRGDGRRYHLNFSRVGFAPRHASLVSFVELLHLPTMGRSQLTRADLATSHLQMIESAMLRGRAKLIFVSAQVAQLLRASGRFGWLAQRPASSGPLPVLYQDAGRTVHLHLHFSNYGKFQPQMREEAAAIAALLPDAAAEALAVRQPAPSAAPRPAKTEVSPGLVVTEPALLIRVAGLHREGMTPQALYEATRGVWRVGERRAEVELVLAVASGIVREVYVAKAWHPAGSTAYTTRSLADVNVPGRWEFTGEPAPEPVRCKYVGRSAAHYFPRGASNPVMYVNVEMPG
ncbi:hypothetical protein LRH25_01100 [Ideonella azotifigens]|uniref:Uncharacterized protein n=1 Tax=Ideonella azotifigens TaxID=513160 RepID=A0ABN1KA86_9BURK|nr:hypothetical protein [Ideonella azotifigens]MCD2338935.1 hypothetical protein [Ideonella azotifigens]